MDNQQLTFELGWIIGLIDGEGTIGISARNRPEASAGFTLKPHVQVSNTDPAVIDRYAGWLRDNRIPFHISSYASKGRRAPSQCVTTAGLKRVSKIMPLLSGNLTGKKLAAAMLVEEFTTSRLADWHAAPFTGRQLEIVKELQSLHTKGPKQKLRDYTRSSRSSKYPNARDEDIVQAV